MKFQAGPTALYAQLASVLRSKITGGEWPAGHEIPTLEDLGQEYKVARVTVRQAIQMLSDEGMLVSQRGRRTCVTDTAVKPELLSIFSAKDPTAREDRREGQTKVLEKRPVADLPPGSFSGVRSGPYVLVEKLDYEGDTPYAMSSLYVAKAVFDRFPKGAIQRKWVGRLTIDFARSKLTGEERITAGVAGFEEAAQLKYAVAAPIIKSRRVFWDPGMRIIFLGFTVYRTDFFCQDYDLTPYLKPSTD